jgi:hypothetical protein
MPIGDLTVRVQVLQLAIPEMEDSDLHALWLVLDSELEKRDLEATGGDRFVDLVAEMRKVQRAFFISKPEDRLARAALIRRARDLESKVDQAIDKNRNQSKMEV